MTNEYINYPVGTVFKEEYYEDMSHHVCYYIVGEYFIYCNDYDCPQIRPWKFNPSECTIATNEEKNEFIEALKKNHLIWCEGTGKLEREFEEVTLSVKVKVKPGTDINTLLERLNDPHNELPWYLYGRTYENF